MEDAIIDWEEMIETVNEETSTTPCSGHRSTRAEILDISTPETVQFQCLYLPSHGNVSPSPANVELMLHMHQAQTHNSQLYDLIADKSFQYSHINEL